MIDERRDAVPGADLLGARPVAIDDRDQPRLRQTREKPRMVLTETPHADDRDPEGPPGPGREGAGQRITPRALVAMKSARTWTSGSAAYSARTRASASSSPRCARNSSL